MFAEDKVTEIFCMADDFCKFFDQQMEKYTVQDKSKRAFDTSSKRLAGEWLKSIMPWRDNSRDVLPVLLTDEPVKAADVKVGEQVLFQVNRDIMSTE